MTCSHVPTRPESLFIFDFRQLRSIDALRSIAVSAQLPWLAVDSLKLTYVDRKSFAHFQYPDKQLVFSGRQVSDVHFRTLTAFCAKLKPITELLPVASCNLATRCSVYRSPNLLKLANLADSRAQTKVACESPAVGTNFRFPVPGRQVLSLKLFQL